MAAARTHTRPVEGRNPRTARKAFLRWTGARPGEGCRLTLAQIDRSGETWLYRPVRHKLKHKNKDRSG
ncbi:MAG: hypothetical protein ACRC33_07120 [Gemmataceae bacterium]